MAIVKTKIRDVKKGDKWTSKGGSGFGWTARDDARPEEYSNGDFELHCYNEDGQRGWFGGYDPEFVIEVEREVPKKSEDEKALEAYGKLRYNQTGVYDEKGNLFSLPGNLSSLRVATNRRLTAAYNACRDIPIEGLEEVADKTA